MRKQVSDSRPLSAILYTSPITDGDVPKEDITTPNKMYYDDFMLGLILPGHYVYFATGLNAGQGSYVLSVNEDTPGSYYAILAETPSNRIRTDDYFFVYSFTTEPPDTSITLASPLPVSNFAIFAAVKFDATTLTGSYAALASTSGLTYAKFDNFSNGDISLNFNGTSTPHAYIQAGKTLEFNLGAGGRKFGGSTTVRAEGSVPTSGIIIVTGYS